MRLLAINASKPGLTHTKLHRHSCWELVVFLSGEGVHHIGNKQIPFRKGMIICQPPDMPHGSSSLNGWQDLYLQVEDYQPPDEQEIPVFFDDQEQHFTVLMQFCLSVFHQNDARNAALAESLFECAQQLLCLWTHEKPGDLIVEHFIAQMMMRLSDPNLHISDMIHQTGYCADAFRRKFRAVTGTTPTAYLLDKRIAHACALLENSQSGMSIKQVAMQCGFEDPFYFSTMFRRRVGVNPRLYRNKSER